MPGSDRAVLTQRMLNRALLARQLLLDRRDTTITCALEAMGGRQAQYAPSMYVGLWSRLADFARADLTEALERRTAVQGTLQRSTIHLVSTADYWPFALAVRDARRRWWSRTQRGTEDQLVAAAERLRAELATAGTLRRADIEIRLGKELAAGVGLWLDLVRV